MTTLKDAQKSGNLEQFIKEHEKDPKGDDDRLKATVKNLALNQPQRPDDTQKRPAKPKP